MFRGFFQIAVLGVIASLGLSGCRFGNHEVDPPGPGVIQGQYLAIPDPDIAICAYLPVTQPNGSVIDQRNCKTVDQGDADFIFKQTITDPVELAYDSQSGLFLLEPYPVPANLDFYFIVASDNAGNLQNPGTSYSPFLHVMADTHPNCDFDMQYAAAGTYGGVTSPTQLPVSGELSLEIDMEYTPNGNDCTQLAACYNNASGCDEADHEFVQQEYKPFIDAGLFTAADIPSVEGLEYLVSYH